MSPAAVTAAIRCPVNLFSRHDARIVALSAEINQAATLPEKVAAAESLMEDVNVLLHCADYDEQTVDCQLCRGFTQLRCGAAGLVMQAGAAHARGARTAPPRRPR